jgi:hypothetical protein
VGSVSGVGSVGSVSGVGRVVWYWRFADSLVAVVAVVAGKGLLALRMAGLFLSHYR